ncbi:MAG TPA: cyclic nucleotide-binding domain-containing protein, partial [Candidatus Binatia bacterium]
MEPLADTIRSIPIFSGLSREDVAKVMGKMEEISFGAGTTIFSQGDQGDAFYLIQSGTVQVVLESRTGNSEIVAILGPQDWFGEMALLSGEPRSATIHTVKDTTLWRLRREDWDELIEKHSTWLLQFCATLSKRLSYVDRQYSTGREAFNSLAEEFYASRSPDEQEFFRQASLLDTLDEDTLTKFFQTESLPKLLAELGSSQFPLIRNLENGKYELHSFFRDFLREKLLAVEGADARQRLHAQFAENYEAIGNWQEAIHHAVQSQDWPTVTRLLTSEHDHLVTESPLFVKNTLESFPADQFLSDLRLVNLRASVLIQLGDMAGAYRAYHDVLAQKAHGALGSDTITGHRRMAETLAQRKEYTQAINHLRSALNLIDQENATSDGYPDLLQESMGPSSPALPLPGSRPRSRPLGRLQSWSPLLRSSSFSRWFGAVVGLGVGGYLWFGQPAIGLDPTATKLLGLISATLIFWVF